MRSHPSTKQILKRIRELERHLNKLEVVPATHRLRSIVVLPLLSKGLTVSRAICVLVDAGFPAEAFATSRTLLEILFSLRYITNKFTEERAEKYLKYQARVKLEWMNIAQKHFPQKAAKLRALDRSTRAIADEFKRRGNWTGERAQTWAMATEEDTFELDEHGKGFKDEFDYDGFYFETSQYVHATVAGIYGHTIKRGEVFRVRGRMQEEKYCAAFALFVTVCTLCKIFIRACRSMNEAQPEAIQELFKMIRKFFRDSRTK
jgi:uncharacterized protein DUF5677